MAGKRKSTKRKADVLEEASRNHVPFRNNNIRRLQYTDTSHARSSTSISIIDRLPSERPKKPVQTPPELSAELESQQTPPKLKTQKAQLLEDFGEHFEELGNLLLEYEADELTGSPCSCNRPGMISSTQCYDCTGYQMSCKTCFVEAHIRSPFHWAEVWDTLQGCFIRHDISKFQHVIQLGHKGKPCKTPVGERMFTVVDRNGIHTTKLAFCGCREQPPNKIKQLMRARLFPATTRELETTFTVNMLKDFQLHNLESKKAAYNYLGAIRRLSDNSFTADIPNPYAAFLCVVRVFNFLTLKKRAGQMHGIDSILAHRPSGNLIVWCPACPEAGFNSNPNCPETPHELRHLNQSQRTLDGNFQCNQSNKNTDPNDVSLCAGKGYFPLDSEYREYLSRIPISKEKSTCNYLNVANKQNKKKFKNMAITGTVNCQCSHVFILSCVDLHYGERFANTDKVLAMDLENHRPNKSFQVQLKLEVDDINEVTTYDIACEYFIHLEERFQANFPHLVPFIQQMRWGVPALHVQGHQDSCTYLFGTAYMECIGHFHGETAEQYWPEANQLGPHVRQMNNGHRQDTMIFHHGDWNHKKLMDITTSLAEAIQEARIKYVEKRNHFIALSISFQDQVTKWQSMDRASRASRGDGKEAMLNDDNAFASTIIPKSRVAHFLEDALKIQDDQRKLTHLIADIEEHDLVSRQKDIEKNTTKLQRSIRDWRKIQIKLMPKVGDVVATQAVTAPAVQEEKLFPPSDFSSEPERHTLDLTSLAAEEVKWREGQIFDSLRAIQNIVKAMSALRYQKNKHSRQQKQNTRSGDTIREAQTRWDHHMESYEAACQALMALNSGHQFPPLTEADLYMKPVPQKRQVGDSRHTDGKLWRAALPTPIDEDIDEDISEEAFETDGLTEEPTPQATTSGTQMDRRKTGPRPRKKSSAPVKIDKRPEGWLWQLGKLTKMTDAEMKEWSSEGDRVQWFRAEAEMQRWQEQGEQKLSELLRTHRSFTKMEETWSALASTDLPIGHQAYAKQKAAMYRKRAQEAQNLVIKIGHGTLLEKDANIIETVRFERRRQAQIIADGIATKGPSVKS
ncbi:hypothetical protein C8J57DRAFT_1243408 [Mycena rebaudengoi]|nr:hypothetical protein C8J57DRAFT_1243408 [Mycena rebaudengoi]